MNATERLNEKQLSRIVAGLLSTVVDVEVHAAKNAEDGLCTVPLLMAHVRISGSVSANVHLVCPVPLIRLAAARMFALEPSTVNMRQLRDALGELTNLVAGAIKSLLPDGCSLSLPVATDGFPPVPQDVQFIQALLGHEGMTMQVLLIDGADTVRHVADESQAVASGPVVGAAAADLVGITVLVIDDDPLIRDLMRLMLESEGCTVHEAADGDEGVALVKNTPCNLVITDILMPGKEGVATCIEVKMVSPSTQVIVMSGADTASIYFSVATKLGAIQSLHKPFSKDELLVAVRHALPG